MRRVVSLPVVPANDNDPAANDDEPARPRVRGDCLPGGCNEARPCPWVSCRYHLFLDEDTYGSLRSHVPPSGADKTGRGANRSFLAPYHKRNNLRERAFIDDVVEAVATATGPTCSLDVADEGSHTLAQVAEILRGLTRERVRQIEASAIRKIKKKPRGLSSYQDHEPEDHTTALVDLEERDGWTW